MSHKKQSQSTRRVVAFLLGLLTAACVPAQEKQEDFSVGFRAGSPTLETAFGDNAQKLDSIVAVLKHLTSDSTLQLLGITLCGSASPEGSATLNRHLALKRLENLETFIRSRVALPDGIISYDSSGIGWERLERMVSQSDMPRKDEVACVLHHSTPANRNTRLKAIDGGRAWQYLLRELFPAMRNARVTCAYAPKTRHETMADNPTAAGAAHTPDTINPADADSVAAPAAVVAAIPGTGIPPKERKPFYMAVKTNMLYDALAVPNIGVELYLKKGWSLAGEWQAAWWSKDSRHRYWRIAGGHLAVRKWLGRKAEEKPLTGHHLGIYAQGLTYDVEWGGKGYMGGKPGGNGADKINYAAGVEYGFSLPVARRLNIDFTLGAGYWGGTYHKYTPQDGHYVWQGTFKRRWFGPTNVEAGLVWLLGHGNVNAGKGGGR